MNNPWTEHNQYADQPVVGHTQVDAYLRHGGHVDGIAAYCLDWSMVKAWRLHEDEPQPPKDPAPAMPIPDVDWRALAEARGREVESLRKHNGMLRQLWVDAAANEELYHGKLTKIKELAA